MEKKLSRKISGRQRLILSDDSVPESVMLNTGEYIKMVYIFHKIPEWCQLLLLDFTNKLNRVMENDNFCFSEKEYEINKLILELRDGIADVREDFDLRPNTRKAEIWSEVTKKYNPFTEKSYLKVTLPEWVECLLWAMKGIDVPEIGE